MVIRFWGVRGSVATSGPETARVGGHTTCLEVLTGGRRIIFDAGTGIRALGAEMMAQGPPGPTDLFWSHLHWDHVQGFPFFAPAYARGVKLSLHGPGRNGGIALRCALERQMEPPGFPVSLAALGASLEFSDAPANDTIEVGDVRVKTIGISHPNGCIGYRVEADGAALVFFTDVEVPPGELPRDLITFCEGADLLVMDGQYTPSEYEGKTGPPKAGWGHTTMIEAARLADAAGVRALAFTHHDPAHGDRVIEKMEAAAALVFPRSRAAREGDRFELASRLCPRLPSDQPVEEESVA